jgi:hypothetical protein
MPGWVCSCGIKLTEDINLCIAGWKLLIESDEEMKRKIIVRSTAVLGKTQNRERSNKNPLRLSGTWFTRT